MDVVYSQLTACLRDLAPHFKTEPTKTVTFCFGYRVFEEGKLSFQCLRPFGPQTKMQLDLYNLYTQEANSGNAELGVKISC
jgi:hypothetical protein